MPPITDERLAKRIDNLEADLAKNISAQERKMKEEGLALLRELQTFRAAEARYVPQMVRYDSPEASDPYWEFIGADVASVTGQMRAVNVELLHDMTDRSKVIGLRVYEAAAKVRAIREGDGEVYTAEHGLRRAREIALQSEAAPYCMGEIVKVADMALGEKTPMPAWMTSFDSPATTGGEKE